jgi:hypothetical protein
MNVGHFISCYIEAFFAGAFLRSLASLGKDPCFWMGR